MAAFFGPGMAEVKRRLDELNARRGEGHEYFALYPENLECSVAV